MMKNLLFILFCFLVPQAYSNDTDNLEPGLNPQITEVLKNEIINRKEPTNQFFEVLSRVAEGRDSLKTLKSFNLDNISDDLDKYATTLSKLENSLNKDVDSLSFFMLSNERLTIELMIHALKKVSESGFEPLVNLTRYGTLEITEEPNSSQTKVDIFFHDLHTASVDFAKLFEFDSSQSNQCSIYLTRIIKRDSTSLDSLWKNLQTISFSVLTRSGPDYNTQYNTLITMQAQLENYLSHAQNEFLDYQISLLKGNQKSRVLSIIKSFFSLRRSYPDVFFPEQNFTN